VTAQEASDSLNQLSKSLNDFNDFVFSTGAVPLINYANVKCDVEFILELDSDEFILEGAL